MFKCLRCSHVRDHDESEGKTALSMAPDTFMCRECYETIWRNEPIHAGAILTAWMGTAMRLARNNLNESERRYYGEDVPVR